MIMLKVVDYMHGECEQEAKPYLSNRKVWRALDDATPAPTAWYGF